MLIDFLAATTGPAFIFLHEKSVLNFVSNLNDRIAKFI